METAFEDKKRGSDQFTASVLFGKDHVNLVYILSKSDGARLSFFASTSPTI